MTDIDVSFNLIESMKDIDTPEYKKYRAFWNRRPQIYWSGQFPLHLDIELTNRCNLNCEMCAFWAKDAIFKCEPQDMEFNLYKRIIDEGVWNGLRAVKLSFRGEPLKYERIVEAVQYAKDKGIIEVMFNTNGTLLTEKLSERLISAGLDKILFSIYDHEITTDNIFKLIELKKEINVEKPIIRINSLKYDNLDTEGFLKFWTPIADQVGLQEIFNYHNINTHIERSDWCCAFLWQRLVILANGDILSCCGMPIPDKVIGNAYRDKLADVWNGGKMRALRNLHKKGKSHLIHTCTQCPMRNKLMEVK